MHARAKVLFTLKTKVPMKSKAYFVLLCLIPSIALAGEPSKGTVIMISGVSAWLVLSSGLVLLRQIRKSRGSQHDAG